eukprot:CAMPEP_0184692572 /NCGR_PEP_ID=MMETSP0313-20130426/995_1 /TAXON_ID=2792 /ORGANISM="Porphyridium aerugineum, Strain SAG 1380-2" /LENGTH=415 /DNA_ID=CAMNT_0027150411 /DNA_START=179 /DNA_END=1426 /DNA_ORIENTATION=-
MRRGSSRGEVDNNRYYELLGVPKDASDAELKKAYRKLAVKHHPDKGGDVEKFQEISHAFEILSDPEKKEIYDRFGEEGLKEGAGGGGMDANDIFEAMFGGGIFGGAGGSGRRSRGPKKGETVQHAIKVTLEDLYKGKSSKIAITRHRVCTQCAGRGATSATAVVTCSTCKGQGAVIRMNQIGPGMIQQVQTACPSCRGTGESIDEKFKCAGCEGKKVVKERKVLEVHIDPGMQDGQKIVFRGEADEEPGAEAGDVIIYVKQLDHPVFQRNGRNLLMLKDISLVDALCGASFTVEHLDGRLLKVHAKEGEVIKTGMVKSIPAEGMPTWKNPFEKGYLFIKFNVIFPVTMSPAHREALQAVFGPKSEPMIPDGVHVDDCEMITFDEEHEKDAHMNGDHGGMQDDDDERGQRVQCAQQ